jgi:dTDP-glucose 4,6-dehydratase
MRRELYKILVTGGAGFIGSEFVRQSVGMGYGITVVDKLTYAGDLERLREVKGKFKFYRTDICNRKQIEAILIKDKPQVVVNFAAETHVDRSIKDASAFIATNVVGTKNMLDLARKYKISKFIQISTDEVYGEIKRGRFGENSALRPNSPYAASKAAADLLTLSYGRTYAFPAVIVRPCNNYGPWQYPEKLIPVIIKNALFNKKVPIYAKGQNVREWLYVSDCVSAILKIMDRGKTGQIYNIGSGTEKRNIEVAKTILGILKRPYSLIEFVTDRPGHDFRYALNGSRIRKLGWLPKTGFATGIRGTVAWYKNNFRWVK